MTCKCCGDVDTIPLWKDSDGGQWCRCLVCGSDSSSWQYEEVKSLYDGVYIQHQLNTHGGGTVETSAAKMKDNLDWFDEHKGKVRGKDFLDVGFCEGGSLFGMQARGWSVHGWDCNPASYLGPHTTISDTFTADQFPQHYDAILCREVLEHNPQPQELLTQMVAALKRPGLVQVQTPRPGKTNHPIPYQKAHLFLVSPVLLRYWLEKAGLAILDRRRWELGQAYLCERK